MVVVPALAERERGEPEDVGRVVLDREAARPEEVADRVDRPRDVVQGEDAHRTAPQRGGQRAGQRAVDQVAEPERHQQADEDPQAERAVDDAHAAVLVEVARVARVLGGAGDLEQPAHVRVPEAGDRALDAAAVAVRRVRVALLVGVRVVLAVVGHPRHHRALHGERAEDRERVLDRLEGLERAVREQPVEAERDPVAADHVHDQHHRQVAPVDQLVPEQDDGEDEPDEREQDPREVEPAVHGGHTLSPTRSDRPAQGSSRQIREPFAVAS